jgi:hypothetical protein
MHIELDNNSINPDELSSEALQRELSLQKRPAWIMRVMMNALEKQRSGKKFGWSRPWNKMGYMIYRTHIHKKSEDELYFEVMHEMLKQTCKEAPKVYLDFIESLFKEEKPMAFTFYHNRTDENGEMFEGLTFGLGRKASENKKMRDRIDIVLEDKRESDGSVDGVMDKIRIYINPWSEYESDALFELELNGEEAKVFDPIYKRSVDVYHSLKVNEDRLWKHWSVNYIDYFGKRDFIAKNSSFL